MRYGEEDEAIHDSKAMRWIGMLIVGTYLIIAVILTIYGLYSIYGLSGLFMGVKGAAILVLFTWLILKIKRW